MLENTAKLAKIEAQKAAYRERCRNFDALKEGLMNKYIAEELDLEDRQQESIFHLTDTAAGDYSLSQGYFHACTAFGKTYLMMAMAEGYRDKEPDKKNHHFGRKRQSPGTGKAGFYGQDLVCRRRHRCFLR